MEIYQTIKVHGRVHVVCPSGSRHTFMHENANYLNTGKALCGVLKKGETLDNWKKRTGKT